jgi:hypothetical protein
VKLCRPRGAARRYTSGIGDVIDCYAHLLELLGRRQEVVIGQARPDDRPLRPRLVLGIGRELNVAAATDALSVGAVPYPQEATRE